MLGQKDRSYRTAERVYVLQPQSADVRNLLVSLHPEKWVEKLRSVPPSKSAAMSKEEEERRIAEAKGAVVMRVDGLGDDANESMLSKAKNLFKKEVGSPEERAKAVAEKAKAKERAAKEKEMKKLKKEADAKKAKEQEKKAKELAKIPKKKTQKDLLAAMPPRPHAPELTNEAEKALNKALEGNENIWIYDPILREFAEIRKATILREQSEGGVL